MNSLLGSEDENNRAEERAFQARVLRWHEQGPRGRMNWTRVGYKEASTLSRAENGYVEQGKDTRVCGSKPMREGLKKPTEYQGA